MREPGYYWVKFQDRWSVGRWNGRYFDMLDWRLLVMDHEVDEVGAKVAGLKP